MCSRDSADEEEASLDKSQYTLVTRSLNELYGEETPEEWMEYMPTDEE